MEILNQIVDLFFPNICFICKEKLAEKKYICEKCEKNLVMIDEGKCFCCGENTSKNGICESCKKELFFDGFISVFEFDKVIQNLIHCYKYEEFKKIGKYLGEILAEKLSRYSFISDVDYILPVPLHHIKKRERGFNQARILGKSVSKKLQIPLKNSAVKRKKYTKSQTKLSKEEREKNVGNAFVIKDISLVKNKRLLIVDDVFTTGSTMKSIASVLKNNGAEKVYASSIVRA